MDRIPARPCSAAHGRRGPNQRPQGAAAGSGRCPRLLQRRQAPQELVLLLPTLAWVHIGALLLPWGWRRGHLHDRADTHWDLLRHMTDLEIWAINLIMCIQSRREAQPGAEQLCRWSANELALAVSVGVCHLPAG